MEALQKLDPTVLPEEQRHEELYPQALVADLKQFEPEDKKASQSGDEWEDPLLELLRRGASLQQEEFIAELLHQRNPRDVASV